METKDWIAIAAALIVAIGWFVTGWLNRVKDVQQKRLEYRLRALESFLAVWYVIDANSAPFSDPTFAPKLAACRTNFQLYGLPDEIERYERFIKAIEDQDLSSANELLRALLALVRSRVRDELQVDG
jgi:hypothetical protein